MLALLVLYTSENLSSQAAPDDMAVMRVPGWQHAGLQLFPDLPAGTARPCMFCIIDVRGGPLRSWSLF
jgi:hypothetical protein